jgi:hypothetical protein
MAINFLATTPIEQERLNPYVSQFVPLPLDQLFKGAAAVQERGETDLKDAYAGLESISKIPSRPNEDYIKQQLATSYADRLAKIQEEYTPGSLPFQREAAKLRSDFIRDQQVTDLNRLSTTQQARLKQRTAFDAANKKYYDFGRVTFDQNTLGQPLRDERGNIVIDPTTNQPKIATIEDFTIDDLQLVAMPEYRKVEQSYFDDAKAIKTAGKLAGSGIAGKLEVLNKTNLSFDELRGAGSEELKALVSNYIQTDAGSTKLRALQHPDYGDLSYDQALIQIGQDLVTAASEREYTEEQRQIYNDSVAVARASKPEEVPLTSRAGTLFQSLTVSPQPVAQEDAALYMGMDKTNESLGEYGVHVPTYAANGDSDSFEIPTSDGKAYEIATAQNASKLLYSVINLGNAAEAYEDLTTLKGNWDALGDGLKYAWGSIKRGGGENWETEREYIFEHIEKKKEYEKVLNSLSPWEKAQAYSLIESMGAFDSDGNPSLENISHLLSYAQLPTKGLNMNFAPDGEMALHKGDVATLGTGYVDVGVLENSLTGVDEDEREDQRKTIVEALGGRILESKGDGGDLLQLPGIWYKKPAGVTSTWPSYDKKHIGGTAVQRQKVYNNSLTKFAPVLESQKAKADLFEQLKNAYNASGGIEGEFSKGDTNIVDVYKKASPNADEEKLKGFFTDIQTLLLANDLEGAGRVYVNLDSYMGTLK